MISLKNFHLIYTQFSEIGKKDRSLKEIFYMRNSNLIIGNHNKIELLHCPNGKFYCREHLVFINKNYLKYYDYQSDKNYQMSIEALKSAFYKTTELKEESCKKCTKLFRSTIIQSLENMHEELRMMSTGLFKTKKFQSSYIESGNLLAEFRKVV